MKRLALALALISIFAFAASAFADDLNPPPWRGQPGTTFALWEFYTPNPNPMPDQWMNPFGPPATTVTPGFLQNWWALWGGREGVWPLSGTIVTRIQNYPTANPYKDIWIQITWAQQAVNEFPVIRVDQTYAQLLGSINLGPTGEQTGDGTWWHSTYSLRLFPNPTQETVIIEGAIMVDELVIDTICVPEPSSLIALSGLVGFVGVAWRRRR